MAQQEKLVSLSGTVVNSITGEPIRHAMVQITRLAPNEGFRGQLVTRTAMSDASGAFRFDGIPDGQYVCGAQKPQFVNSPEFDRQCPASGNVRIPLSPLGVITGRVVDQDGLPLRAVNIYALSTHVLDGLRHPRTDRSVTTDDRGMYRLWNLAPGKYLIKASGLAAGTSWFVGDTSSASTGEAYATVYFGGARIRDSATPVEVKAGAEAVADIAITVEHGYSVRGTLSGITPRGDTVRFEMVVGNDATPVRVSLNNESGRFTVLGLPAGSFTLRATQAGSIAERLLSIQGSDVTGADMKLEPPVDVPVNIRFTNEAPKEAEPQSFFGQNTSCGVQLRSQDGGVYPFQENKVAGVPPGRYHAIAQCFSAYPVSVTYGTQDLSAMPEVTIASGSSIPIEILATHGGGKASIEPSKALIVLLPRSGGEPVAFSFLTIDGLIVPQAAESTLSGIRPGAYTAYAFLDAEEAEYRNPDFVRTLTGGVPVQIEEGQETKIAFPGVTP